MVGSSAVSCREDRASAGEDREDILSDVMWLTGRKVGLVRGLLEACGMVQCRFRNRNSVVETSLWRRCATGRRQAPVLQPGGRFIACHLH